MGEEKRPTAWMKLWFQDMDCLNGLSADNFRNVINALRALAETGKEAVLDDPSAQMAYAFMAKRTRQDCENYEKRCERNRENAQKKKPNGSDSVPLGANGCEVRSKKEEERSKKREDIYNNNSPPSESSKPTKKPKVDPEMEKRFDDFWREYPRKQAKQEALKAFLKLSPDEVTFARKKSCSAQRTLPAGCPETPLRAILPGARLSGL